MSNGVPIPPPPGDYVPMGSPVYKYHLQRHDPWRGWVTIAIYDIERHAQLACPVAGYRVQRVPNGGR